MAEHNWIMVRVDRETHGDLERVRASMLVGELMGLTELEHDFRNRVSLSQVIARLIAFRDRHAERSRRAKARRRLKAIQEAASRRQGEEENQGGGVR